MEVAEFSSGNISGVLLAFSTTSAETSWVVLALTAISPLLVTVSSRTKGLEVAVVDATAGIINSEFSEFANPGVGTGSNHAPKPSGILAYDLFGGTGSHSVPLPETEFGSPGVGSYEHTSWLAYANESTRTFDGL